MLNKSRRVLVVVATSLLITLLAVGFAYSFPVDLALLAAVDVSAYVDALVGVYVIANFVKLRPLLQLWRRRAGRLFGRAARRSRSSCPRVARSAKDDDAAAPFAKVGTAVAA